MPPYVKGRSGLYGAFDITVAATVPCGVTDALVQGGVIEFVLELPGWYMQPVIAESAASGELPSSAPIIASPAMQHHLHIALALATSSP
jgi:solute carrier family 29 (equilibrative nucleoside transporter), member 1/2/3